MATSKFTPTAVPLDASPALRSWLDEQMRRLQLLVNNAAQLGEDFPADPGADSILFWDDSDTAAEWITELPDSFLSANVPLLDAASNSFTGALVIGGVVTGPIGAVGAPTYSFTGDEDTGIYRDGADIIAFASGGTRIARMNSSGLLMDTGAIRIREQAAVGPDAAAVGQIWVKNTTPCQLWFTDDAGTDHQIAFV